MVFKEEVQMKKLLDVIQEFTGAEPVSRYLNSFFRAHPNMGSRDRRFYTNITYTYFRLKGNFYIPDTQKLIALAAMYCEEKQFADYWANHFFAQAALEKKDIPAQVIANVENQNSEAYFPLYNHISPAIQLDDFYFGHLDMPHVWIRFSQDYAQEIKDELEKNNFIYTAFSDTCIFFKQKYALDKLACYADGLFEIQDIASQQTATLFEPTKNESWWDCCAGAGGKSLLLLEQQPQIQLFVSDVRESIIANLHERFYRNGFSNYNSVIIDLMQAGEKELNKIPIVDAIIADVPCSGSGTWSRSPEWLTYFTSDMLDNYIEKQKKIITTAIQQLKSGGKLIYITCSVYQDENENNTAWMSQHLPLHLEEQHYFQYSKQGGDTLFAAVLIKQ